MEFFTSIGRRIRSRRALAMTGAVAMGVAAAVAASAFAPADASQAGSAIHNNPAIPGQARTMNAGLLPGVNPHAQVNAPMTETLGMDVSDYQGDVNWSAAAQDGAKFAYILATDGTDYTNPYFSQQYTGSYNAGIIRGSYHFARPTSSSGATQADYFIAHGGGWSGDGKTLPGALDIEANPTQGGPECWGLSAAQIASFVSSFVNEYHAKEHVYPVIYTGTGFWNDCVGTAGSFGANDPLWAASWGASPGSLHNWTTYTFWQYADSGTLPGDQDYFNGPLSGVQTLAKNG